MRAKNEHRFRACRSGCDDIVHEDHAGRMRTGLPHVCPRIPGVPLPLTGIDGHCAGQILPPGGGGQSDLISLGPSASQHGGDADIARYSLGAVLAPPCHQVASPLARRTTGRRRRHEHPRPHPRIRQVPVSPQPAECAHHQRAAHISCIASATLLRAQEHLAMHSSIGPAHHDGNSGVQAWRREEGRILLAQALAPNAQPRRFPRHRGMPASRTIHGEEKIHCRARDRANRPPHWHHPPPLRRLRFPRVVLQSRYRETIGWARMPCRPGTSRQFCVAVSDELFRSSCSTDRESVI